jgi:FkbM family methyltransferase
MTLTIFTGRIIVTCKDGRETREGAPATGTTREGLTSARSTSLPARLRPAKIRSALRRRWFERRLARLPVSGRGDPVALGTTYGAWMTPCAAIGPGWTCYCVGAGADISFDLELIRRFDARIRCIDPVQEYLDDAVASADGDPHFLAYRAAIATRDGPLQMQRTHHPGSRSLSSAGLYDTQEYEELPGRTLPSLMAELGDERIDLLKLDIEGGEYEVLPTLDLPALSVKVFAIQLHHNQSAAAARALIADLEAEGYELVATVGAVRLTFVHRDALAALTRTG